MLLADDSITIQKVVDLTFADEGMQVVTVSNGEQAILKLEEVAPDIVLADIFMPGRSGYEVCEHIKRDERFSHIPVMLLVGSFEPFDEAEARRVGADDFLTKPFQSIRQLVNKVSALLGGGEGEGPTQDLELPPEAARAERERAAKAEPPAEITLINTAPLPQIRPDEPQPSSGKSEASFADMSFDDELIETKPVSDFSGASAMSSAGGIAEPRPTAPLSSDDIVEAGIQAPPPPPPSQSFSDDQMQETIRNFTVEEMNEEPSNTKTSAPQMARATAADDALLDLGEIEPPAAAAQADDFFLDLLDDMPSRHSAPEAAPPREAATSAGPLDEMEEPFGALGGPAPPAEFAEQQQQPSAEATQEQPLSEEFTQSQTGGPLSYEDFANLAEARAKFMEPQVISHGSEESPTVRLPENFKPEEMIVECLPVEVAPLGESEPTAETEPQASPSTPQPGGGRIGLDQLAPEVIETIARRVVEQMSERVVQEIAWEVVPQLAELLIKRRLEEEKKQ